jgi:Ca2+-binding RTX toxin-like protein
VTGGPGHDHFVFDHKLTGQTDKITNFDVGADKIVLSEKDFAGLGPHGTLTAVHFHLGAPANGHAQIDYFKSTGVLDLSTVLTAMHGWRTFSPPSPTTQASAPAISALSRSLVRQERARSSSPPTIFTPAAQY